jgi:hypothetical protein
VRRFSNFAFEIVLKLLVPIAVSKRYSVGVRGKRLEVKSVR